jgi:adenylate cyclase
VDATNGYHLWADQYDRYLKELFALQDEITHKVVVALQVELTEGEQAHVRHRSTNNLKAWGYAVRGYSLFERYNKEDNIKARELLEQAVKIDPKYAWAWTWLAFTHWTDARFGFSKSRTDSFKRAVELAQKAISLDESDPEAHSLLGFIYLFQRQHDKAIAEGEKSIVLGPNNAENHAHFAVTMFHAGRFEEAVGLCMKAMRLSPHYPPWYLVAFGAPNLFLGRYEEAIDAFVSCLERVKEEGGAILILANCYLAATYSELGRVEEARAQASEVLNLNPNFSLDWVRESAFSKDPAQLERFLDGLRKAGLK